MVIKLARNQSNISVEYVMIKLVAGTRTIQYTQSRIEYQHLQNQNCMKRVMTAPSASSSYADFYRIDIRLRAQPFHRLDVIVHLPLAQVPVHERNAFLSEMTRCAMVDGKLSHSICRQPLRLHGEPPAIGGRAGIRTA